MDISTQKQGTYASNRFYHFLILNYFPTHVKFRHTKKKIGYKAIFLFQSYSKWKTHVVNCMGTKMKKILNILLSYV